MRNQKLTLLFCLVWCLMAFTAGDYAELNTLMNARNFANFLPETKNIKFTVPKGTVGKVINVKRFQSGNMGIEVELLNQRPGEKVWIYYWPHKKNLSFYKENPLEKQKAIEVKEEDGKYTRANTLSPAVREIARIDTRSVGDLKKSLEILGKLNGSSKNSCTNCPAISESTFAGQKREQSCNKKNIAIGNIEVYQDVTEGLCTVMIKPSANYEKTWPRRYQFNSDGHFESIDPAGARGAYFFPRKNNISYSLTKDGKAVIVQTTSDVQIYFSTKSGKVLEVTHTKSAKEGSYNKAGAKDSEHLKIEPLPSNPVLDLPYQSGASPERKKSGSAIFSVGSGQTCVLPNTSVFKYNYDSDRYLKSVDFKFSRDSDFLNLVKSKCR